MAGRWVIRNGKWEIGNGIWKTGEETGVRKLNIEYRI
jgi:hypothetical protein